MDPVRRYGVWLGVTMRRRRRRRRRMRRQELIYQ
jgi:hypothetical protein